MVGPLVASPPPLNFKVIPARVVVVGSVCRAVPDYEWGGRGAVRSEWQNPLWINSS
jgi:hypothetical protein